MKKMLFTALAFCGLQAFAQLSLEKNPGDFDKITTFDQIDATLIPSAENKVIINGKNAAKVEVINKSGELKIRMTIEKLLQGDNISVTLYYKKISQVEANEGSRVASNEAVDATIFTVEAKEGSEIKLNVNAQKINVKVGGGSKIELSGSTKTQDVLVNSGGEYKGEDMQTEQTTVTANAGGQAQVRATELIEAKVRAGGTIDIYGNPKQVNEKTIAGGTINRKG